MIIVKNLSVKNNFIILLQYLELHDRYLRNNNIYIIIHNILSSMYSKNFFGISCITFNPLKKKNIG